jgi:hypothetical protein
VNWYYERCELVTAPSQSVFDEMVALGFKNVKSRVVSNPIDTVMFTPMDGKGKKEDRSRKKFGLGDATLHHRRPPCGRKKCRRSREGASPHQEK